MFDTTGTKSSFAAGGGGLFTNMQATASAPNKESTKPDDVAKKTTESLFGQGKPATTGGSLFGDPKKASTGSLFDNDAKAPQGGLFAQLVKKAD